MPLRDELSGDLETFGLSVEPDKLDKLCRYVQILEHWNAGMNLTRLSGPRLVRRLITEPLWVASRLGPTGRYVDIGSGNGSPAVPWLLAGTFRYADLFEARRRRAVFLAELLRQLDLTMAHVQNHRFGGAQARQALPSEPDWITLQGVRLTRRLREEVRKFKGAKVVWLTREDEFREPGTETLTIPRSGRSAIVFDA